MQVLHKKLSQQTQPTNQTSQFWSRARNKAVFYSVQETCTRKNLYEKPRQTCRFLVQVDCVPQWRLITGCFHRCHTLEKWNRAAAVYLSAERVQFSDRHPALDCAARDSARCRRSAGRRGRPPSQCWRSASCLHFQRQSPRTQQHKWYRTAAAAAAWLTAWQVRHTAAGNDGNRCNLIHQKTAGWRLTVRTLAVKNLHG